MATIRTLTVRYMTRFRDHRIWYPRRCDGHLIHHAIFGKHCNPRGGVDKSLAEELEARGYDLTTLVFQCQQKKVTP